MPAEGATTPPATTAPPTDGSTPTTPPTATAEVLDPSITGQTAAQSTCSNGQG